MSDAAVPHLAKPNEKTARFGTGWLKRALDSDMFHSFRRSKMTMVAAAVTVLFFLLALLVSFDCQLKNQPYCYSLYISTTSR